MNRNNLKYKNWLCLSALITLFMVSITSGKDEDSTSLIAYFTNGNSDVFNSRVYLWNPSDRDGEVSVQVFTLPTTGGTAQELTTTPLALGTLKAKSALNIKLAEDILVPLGITLPYTADGGNLTLKFTITTGNVQGTAQVFSSSFTFGTYPLRKIPSITRGSPTVLVANFMNGNSDAFNSRVYLWNPSDVPGEVSVRVFTLPLSDGTADELTTTPIMLGTLESESALNIKLAEDILVPLGIPLPYTTDGGNLTVEFTITAPDIQGAAQVFSSDFAFGTYPLLEPDVRDCQGTVVFADSKLESAVRDELGIDQSAPITCGLEKLEASGEGIQDLAGLEFFPRLTELDLDNNSITDISPLSGLTQLKDLGLESNAISDISALAGLIQMKDLDLDNNNITDLTALAGLTQMVELGLESNNISDLSPLAGLTQLMKLELGDNSISNLAVVSGFTQLFDLDLETNSISDISPLISNLGLGASDIIDLRNNLLGIDDCTNIQTLTTRGATVRHDVTCP